MSTNKSPPAIVGNSISASSSSGHLKPPLILCKPSPTLPASSSSSSSSFQQNLNSNNECEEDALRQQQHPPFMLQSITCESRCYRVGDGVVVDCGGAATTASTNQHRNRRLLGTIREFSEPVWMEDTQRTLPAFMATWLGTVDEEQWQRLESMRQTCDSSNNTGNLPVCPIPPNVSGVVDYHPIPLTRILMQLRLLDNTNDNNCINNTNNCINNTYTNDNNNNNNINNTNDINGETEDTTLFCSEVISPNQIATITPPQREPSQLVGSESVQELNDASQIELMAANSLLQAALQLADYFVQHGIRLVYGGGMLGLMGKLATRVHEQGGQVLGIIPHALYRVCGNQSIGETRLVKTMHERKLAMHHESDAFIALPGGFGTMEELIETATWSQLRIHHKPVAVLNVNGFYQGLLDWIRQAAQQGFIDSSSSRILVVEPTVDGLMRGLCDYEDPFKNSRNGDLSKEVWEETIL